MLPNLPLAQSIGCDLIALAPAADGRVTKLKKAHPQFRKFLNRFADNFGEKFEPAVMLTSSTAPETVRNVQNLASYRDLAALSVITQTRSLEVRKPGMSRVLFGESFAIYPWMLDRDFDDLIGSTPAILGTHLVSSFKGQSSPSLSRAPLGLSDIDQNLLAALTEVWCRHLVAATPAWPDTALLRSLNMAYHATLMPSGTEMTFYDVGRIISLWVSAFEILVHPGGNGIANRDKVFDLLESTKWVLSASAALSYDTGRKTKTKRTAASWLYQELYELRNDFLHGNPVERDRLILAGPSRSIYEYAAPLFRLALTAFLPLNFDAPQPSLSDAKAAGEWLADKMTFEDAQKDAERAVLAAAGVQL